MEVTREETKRMHDLIKKVCPKDNGGYYFISDVKAIMQAWSDQENTRLLAGYKTEEAQAKQMTQYVEGDVAMLRVAVEALQKIRDAKGKHGFEPQISDLQLVATNALKQIDNLKLGKYE